MLRHACTADKIPWPQTNFLCTMVLARRAFRLPSYRLPYVAAECGVELAGRHQVLINARGAALVAVAMARRHGAGTPAELADPDHPLYGRVIVFTGKLATRTRQQAWNDASRVGGIPEKAVSGRTNIVVIGELNPATLTPGAATSDKAARAFALLSKGQDIEVMTEDDFLRSL